MIKEYRRYINPLLVIGAKLGELVLNQVELVTAAEEVKVEMEITVVQHKDNKEAHKRISLEKKYNLNIVSLLLTLMIFKNSLKK